MTNIFIILVLLVAFFFIIQKYVVKKEDLKDHSYRAKGPLFSSDQGAFYNALCEAVGESGVILAKVVMTSVITPKEIRNKKELFIATSRISKSYFDFVVCDPRTFEPRVVIELDNGKELSKGKIEREKLIMHVCKSANLPLIGTSVKHSYQVGRLRGLLATHIDLITTEKEIRFCKKCGSPMVERVASQGEFRGRRFFTCSRGANCNYTENYNVVYEAESLEVKPRYGNFR